MRLKYIIDFCVFFNKRGFVLYYCMCLYGNRMFLVCRFCYKKEFFKKIIILWWFIFVLEKKYFYCL